MCICSIVHGMHSEFSMVVAFNRDEFYTRSTEAMAEEDGVITSVDRKHGGSYYAVSTDRWAVVLNLDTPVEDATLRSRGSLPSSWVRNGGDNALEFGAEVWRDRHLLRPFKLLYGTGREAFMVTSDTEVIALAEACGTPYFCIGVGNAGLGLECLRATKLTDRLAARQGDDYWVKELPELLSHSRGPDAPKVNRGDWGTVSSLIITMRKNGTFKVEETCYYSMGK